MRNGPAHRNLNAIFLGSVVLLTCLELVSALVNGVEFMWLIVADLSPYLLLFTAIWALFSFTDGKAAEKVMVVLAAAVLLYECVYGVLQLIGKSSPGHFYYRMTGDFGNPGPYGGFIAALLAVTIPEALKYRKARPLKTNALPLLCAAASIPGIVILPLTLSRTAFAAFAFAVLLYISRIEAVRRFVSRRKWTLAAAAAVLAVAAVLLFNFKKESAKGRLHIWKIEAKAIAAKPLTGYGPGMALGAYGDAQELYFREGGPFSAAEIRAAGVPEYAFSEYLRFGMECGVPGLVLSALAAVCALLLLRRKRSALEYALAVLVVFSLASYPLSLWQFRILAAILLGAAAGARSRGMAITAAAATVPAAILALLCAGTLIELRDARTYAKEARLGIAFGSPRYCSDSLAKRLSYLRNDGEFLYDCGYRLRTEGRYEDSNGMLALGKKISANPSFNLLTGQNLEDMGEYGKAEKEYLSGYYKVPCRIRPLYLLMEMRLKQGEDRGALEMAQRISRMPVNRKVRSMATMKSRAIAVRDSLSNTVTNTQHYR